jgi:hypothetical protein
VSRGTNVQGSSCAINPRVHRAEEMPVQGPAVSEYEKSIIVVPNLPGSDNAA